MYNVASLLDELISVAYGDVQPPFSQEEAQIIADAIGIDFSKSEFDLQNFQDGLAVELEHGERDPQTDVVHHNFLNLGKIAWAHLKEDPEYYSKLATIEDH